MTRDLRSQLILMTAQSQLFEIGATSDEADLAIQDEDKVIGEMLAFQNPHQWAMLTLARIRDVQSAERKPML